MAPAQIRQNLQRRAGLEQRAAAKLGNAYKSGGYNPKQVDELVGADPVAAPAASKQVVRTGRTKSGKKAVQYSDGTTAILD